MSLIPYLLDCLFPPRDTELLLRATDETALLFHIAPRTVPNTSPATTALLPFQEPLVRAAIHEAKYVRNKKAHLLLARVLEDYLFEYLSEHPDCVLVPIPLSKKRLRERGFNQCEQVVRCAPHIMPLLQTNLLMRTRDTQHQARLSGNERKENISDAFSATPLSKKTTYILLDDVITTGATMHAAVTALKKAGARYIHPIALAH